MGRENDAEGRVADGRDLWANESKFILDISRVTLMLALCDTVGNKYN